MTLTTECRERLEALEQATARLAGLFRDPTGQADRALRERARAAAALARWIEGEQKASRPLSQEFLARLARDLERAAEIQVRMALDRDAARLALAEVTRGLQILRGLRRSVPQKLNSIDCRG